MANDLTGDYDVAAQFTVAALNRVLAAMHRGNRFPHSLSMRVDDTPQSKRSARSIVDVFGNAVSDRVLVGETARPALARSGFSAPLVFGNVDPVITGRGGMNAPIHDFSSLQGIAQLQLGAPTLELPPDESANATVHTPVMVRYFPDPNTKELTPHSPLEPPPITETLRGDILTTFGVETVSSEAGTFINAGLVGTAGNIHFRQLFPAQQLNSDALDAVNKVLRNSLLTGFHPSTAPLPEGMGAMDFKSFPDSQVATALMNFDESSSPSPDSAETVFLSGDDQFALAVKDSLIVDPFAQAANNAINQVIPGRKLSFDTKTVIDYVIGTKTFHIFTNVTVRTATVQLQDVASGAPGGNLLDAVAASTAAALAPGTGQILITIPVAVRFGWENKPDFVPDPVDFDFTIGQAFTLTLSGRDVGLATLGNLVINIPGNVPGQEADLARTTVQKYFSNNNPLAAGQQQLPAAISANSLQEFLTKLMNPDIPPPKAGTPAQKQQEKINPQLTYTSFEIKPAGIVLHGSLSVPDWPPAHVEFDLDQWTATAAHPEYNALNSWIPGGTIGDFVWSYTGTGVLAPDPNTFVSSNAPAIGWAPKTICLTIEGSRLSSSGPVQPERVISGRVCKGTSIPNAAIAKGFPTGNLARLPNVALFEPSPVHDPRPPVVAHVSPWVPSAASGGAANFLIHFPDQESAAHLNFLGRALEHSGRSDTGTAILCVLTSDQLSKAHATDGLMFADDSAGWERLFDVSRRPATVLLGASGRVVWRHQGAVTVAELAAALEKHLVAGGSFFPQIPESPLRPGQRAPDFLFEYSPGHELNLRKLTGRPVAILFFNSSTPSRDTLRNLHVAATQPGVEGPVILAVSDGEAGASEGGQAGRESLPAVVIRDPDRSIANAYGVSVWPTTVFVDAEGMIKEIRYGLITEAQLQPTVEPGREGMTRV